MYNQTPPSSGGVGPAVSVPPPRNAGQPQEPPRSAPIAAAELDSAVAEITLSIELLRDRLAPALLPVPASELRCNGDQAGPQVCEIAFTWQRQSAAVWNLNSSLKDIIDRLQI